MSDTTKTKMLVANTPMTIDNLDIVISLPRTLPKNPHLRFDGLITNQIRCKFVCSSGNIDWEPVVMPEKNHGRFTKVPVDAEILTLEKFSEVQLPSQFIVTLIGEK